MNNNYSLVLILLISVFTFSIVTTGFILYSPDSYAAPHKKPVKKKATKQIAAKPSHAKNKSLIKPPTKKENSTGKKQNSKQNRSVKNNLNKGVSLLYRKTTPIKSKFNIESKGKFYSGNSNKVNKELKKEGYDPPYKNNSKVFILKTQKKENFVRLYDGEKTKLSGRWIMRENDIRGMSAKQIKNKFALPTTPKYIAKVTVPANTQIRFGVVGKNYRHSGGGKQYELF